MMTRMSRTGRALQDPTMAPKLGVPNSPCMSFLAHCARPQIVLDCAIEASQPWVLCQS